MEIIGIEQNFTNENATCTSDIFVRKIISMWIVSVIIPMASPKYQDGFLLSNIYFRQAAAIKPARIVATVQASLVYSPPPHNVENQRSTPPITPEIIPAGAPKISPAQIGAAAALNTEQEITVSGLKEKEKVDIFKDVSIKVNGISPECSIAVSYTGAECSPYDFQIKTVDGKEVTGLKFKNGNKVIISLNESKVKSLEEEYIIEETSREYTIQADKKYILSADDLSEKDVAALKKISDDYADNRFIKLNDWTQEEAAIVISKLTGLNSLILASEGNTHIKSVENLKYDSAYVGIGKTAGYFGQVKEERFAYFFYVGDLTYSYKNKETLLSDLALLVRLQDPVIDKNGKITYSKINFGIRESLDAALDEMLNGDFDKIS